MLKKILVLLFPLALIGQPTNQFKCQDGCIKWGTKNPRSFSTKEALKVHNDWHKGFTCWSCGIVCTSKDEKLNTHECFQGLAIARRSAAKIRQLAAELKSANKTLNAKK